MEGVVSFALPIALAALLAAVAAIWPGAKEVVEDRLVTSPQTVAGSQVPPGQMNGRPPAPPRVGEALLLASFPPGSTWSAELWGGFVGRLAPERPRASPEPHVAFVFDLAIRRHIESNDGAQVRAVVEFPRAAAAKLLTSAEPLVLADFTDRARPLPFPELGGLAPGEAALIPAERIARAILADGADEVARCSTSRGFLQREALAGNRVAITYRDGRGIESITPLDGPIGWHEVLFLLWSGLVCEAALLSATDAGDAVSWTCDSHLLGGLLAPSMRAMPVGAIWLSPGPIEGFMPATTPRELRVRAAAGSGGEGSASPGLSSPEGIIRFAEDGPWIASATMQWTMAGERLHGDALLFESHWIEPPRIVVHYRRRAVVMPATDREVLSHPAAAGP